MSPNPQEQKPNCYKCVHRRPIPGDAHSSCSHPSTGSLMDDPMAKLMALFGHGPQGHATDLGVTGDPHGIQNGWFAWPINYDPAWLWTCNGFEEKKA